MLVEKVVSPPLDNNAYLLVDETSKQAAVVDPALAGTELRARAEKLGAKIVYVLNTHGHPDSTVDDGSLRSAVGAKVAIFEVDAPRLERHALRRIVRPHRRLRRQPREDDVLAPAAEGTTRGHACLSGSWA